MSEKILLFIPGYNCEKQITRVLKQLDNEIMSYIDEVVFINNRSTDNTEKVVLDFKKQNTNFPIKLLRNKDNYNLGGSHKVAFSYAIKNDFDYIIVLHGDDQGDIHDILPILKSKDYLEHDCMLGSRFEKKSKIKGYSLFRQFGNRIFNLVFSIFLHKKITDLGAGLNMYSSKMLKSEFYIKYPDKLTFNCYMLLAVNCYKQRIKFFPISWREDDQVSNVKMFSQAKQTLGLVLKYFFKRKKYLELEHRNKIIENYEADEIEEGEGANMNKIHLIMPMGGAGSRFFKNGFVLPKPLIQINDKPFLYWATKSITNYVDVEDVTFVVLKEHTGEKFKIDEVIHTYFPNAKIEIIPELLNGAVLTCMNGIKSINDDQPIIFNDCDHLFYCDDFYNFCKEGNFDELDGAVLTFESNDPKFSYLKMNENGHIVGTVEKQVASNYAICGAYYFKNKKLFMECANEYLEKCNYSEYFVSGVYNIMAEKEMKIKNFSCNEHLPFGTPDEYYDAEKSNQFKRLK